MSNIVRIENIEKKLIEIRNQNVLIDSDVAEIYGVETKRINEAVKNNPSRFPRGYYFEVDKKAKIKLVENFDRFNKMKHSTVLPKPFE